MALLFDLMAKGIAIANTNRHVQTEARQFDLIAPLLILLRSFHHQCESDEVVNLNYTCANKRVTFKWKQGNGNRLTDMHRSSSFSKRGFAIFYWRRSKSQTDIVVETWTNNSICVKVQVAVFYLECVRMRILTCTVFDAG